MIRNTDEAEARISGTWIIIALALFSLLADSSAAADRNADRIQPYSLDYGHVLYCMNK